MTTYSENWSGEADGVYPSALTKRWVTTDEVTVAANADADAEGNFTFEQEWSANGRRLNEWTAVNDGNEDDIELLVRFKIDTTIVDQQFQVILRGSGAAGSENGYNFWIDENGTNDLRIQLSEYTAGVSSAITASANRITNYVLGDWINFRCRVNGAAPATLQAKLWLDGPEEPTDWDIDTTDTGHTGTGWNGFGAFDGGSNTEVDYIAGGTNGDTAPFVASASTITRLTHMAAKVVHQNAAGDIRLTAQHAKVLYQNDAGEIRLTHMGLKVMYSAPPSPARISTLATEVLRKGDTARISTLVTEVLRKGDAARISTLTVEVLRTTTQPVAADHAIPAEWTQGVIWPAPADGDGLSESSPILIASSAELIAMDLAKHYALANDIDVGAENWTPLGATSTPFTGSLDGRGFKIFDLNSTYNAAGFGLFYEIAGPGIIRRLGVATTVAGITGQSSSFYTAVLVSFGNVTSEWLIEDCWVEGKVDTGGDRCGGLIGVTNFNQSPDSNLRRNRVAVELDGTIGTRVGGVTGFSSGGGLTHSDNYFDSDVATTTSQGTGSVGTAKTTTLMREEATFNNFDFTDVWVIDEGVGYPFLIEYPAVQRTFPAEWTGLLELDHVIPVEWLLEVVPGVESDHQIPIEWIAALELDHQIHMDWSGVLQLDHQVPIEWGLLLSQSFEIPIEWQLIAQASHQIPAEWTQGIDSDHQIPALWDGSFFADYPIHIDWSGFLELDYQLPIEWGLELSQDHQIPIDWIALLASDHEIPIAWNRIVRRRGRIPKEHKRKVRFNTIYPIEWGGGVAGDQVAPIEWLGAFASDQQMHIGWSGILQLDYQVPIEWDTRLPDSDHGIPAEWTAGLALDYVVPIEWFGGFAASFTIHIDWSGILQLDHQIPAEWISIITPSDHPIPAEWGGGIEPVAHDSILPIEWGGGVAGDQEIPAEWLAGLAADQLTPAEWMAALESSHQVPIEWGTVLEPLAHDSVIPIEWDAGVASDQVPPIEWLGALAADYVIPTEWLAALIGDHEIPIEWVASLVAQHFVPVEWGAQLQLVQINIPASWTQGISIDQMVPIEWPIATDPVFADFQIPLEWVQALASDHQPPLDYTVTLRFDHRIPLDWRLEGFQPFTPHAEDCLIWIADCSPMLWTVPDSQTSWVADPEQPWSPSPSTTATQANPTHSTWQACSSGSLWLADEFCGVVWVADPLPMWEAHKSPTLWTADGDTF